MGTDSTAIKVMKGLAILTKHPGCTISASHDTIYAGPDNPGEVSDEECIRLKRLGWVYEDEHECWLRFV